MKSTKKILVLLSLLAVIALVFTACAPKPEEPVVEEPVVEEPMEEPMKEVSFPYRAGGFLEKAIAGEYEGTTVTVDGPFTDADEVKFKESYGPFEEATGITINYIGNKEFEGTISIRVDGGDPPDIADFPQPGLLGNLAKAGHVVDVGSFIPEEWLKEQYNDSWLQMGTMAGSDGDIMAGVWYRFSGKSLVWYPKDDFDAAGYEIPTTWDELVALMDQIVADGDTP